MRWAGERLRGRHEMGQDRDPGICKIRAEASAGSLTHWPRDPGQNGASEPRLACLNNATCIIPSSHSDASILGSVPEHMHEEKLESKTFSERPKPEHPPTQRTYSAENRVRPGGPHGWPDPKMFCLDTCLFIYLFIT